MVESFKVSKTLADHLWLLVQLQHSQNHHFVDSICLFHAEIKYNDKLMFSSFEPAGCVNNSLRYDQGLPDLYVPTNRPDSF